MNSFDLSWVMMNAWGSYRLCDNQRTFNERLRNAWEAACEEIVHTGCCNAIKGNRCHLRPDYNIAATGQTYPIRKNLRWMGFECDPECRYWYTESAEVAYFFAAA